MSDIKSLIQGMIEYWHLQGRPEGRLWEHVREMNDAMAGLEVALVMEASTAHCTPADMGLLELDGGPTVCVAYPSEYGALVLASILDFAPDEDPFLGQKGQETWSSGLRDVVRRARAAGCRWVKFDRDGPEINGIERYQW
jgi:hypothetical protein